MHVESRGYRINYVTFGSSEDAVVLLHGHLQAAEDWVNAGYPALLEPLYRVVAIDMLGYGDSDKPHDVDAHNLDGRVADVGAVLDAEGIRRAVIWGYSMGAIAAEAFAKQHPERSSALVSGGQIVGLTPKDRENIFVADAALMERVGVRACLDESWLFLTAARRELFVRRNDPLAAGAAARGTAMRHASEDAQLPDSAINYVGTAEPWFEVAAAVAAEKHVEFAGVSGADHAETFQCSNIVVPMVLEYLGRT